MKKLWIWTILLAALLLVAACRPVAELEETATAEPTATEEEELGICEPADDDCGDETAVEEPTAVPTVKPTAAPAIKPTEDTAETDATDPASAELVEDPLAIRDTDWVMGGGEDPIITLLEYGDFL